MFSHLFDVFKKSVTSPAFYGELIKKPLKYSLKYYFLVALFLSVVMTIVAAFYGVPGAYFAVRTIAPAVVDAIPDDFSLTIKDGIATSNSAEPIVIGWPDHEIILKAAKHTDYKNFLVIDTRFNASSQAFQDSDAMFFIARDSLVSAVDRVIQVLPFTGVPDVVITKASFSSLVEESRDSFHWVISAFVFFTFLRFLLMFAVELVALLIPAVIFWALLSVKRVGVELPFKKSYQFAIHAASLSLIYYAFVLAFPFLYVPFLFLVITVIVFWANILKDRGAHLRSIHAHHAHASHSGHHEHHKAK